MPVAKVRALSVNEAQAIVVACLSAAYPPGAGSDLSVTISSQVSVKLGADKKIVTVRFSPPLRPDLQQTCAGSLFGRALEVSGGSASFRVHFSAK